LNTDNESLPITDAGSEFQTDGAAHRKERFSKPVRANGWMSSGVADERRPSVRALTRRLMRWLRYCGTDVFRVLYVNTDTDIISQYQIFYVWPNLWRHHLMCLKLQYG